MEIELNAKCGNCGYIQVLKGFEKIVLFNKSKRMDILYNNFLLVHECRKCKSDYCIECSCKCNKEIEA